MDINFDAIKGAIDDFTKLIKAFTKMIKDFVDSWKKELTYDK